VGEDLGSILAPVLAGVLWSTWGIGVAMTARIGLALVTEAYAVVVVGRRSDLRRESISSVSGSHQSASRLT
jgi:hypothetical protein